MSDKALVKHLQKELARLESELRSPGPTSSKSYAETLLKEKDAQIKKMEKEIKELIQQRDVAQSWIQDLTKESRPWDGFSRLFASHIPSAYDDELSMYDSSDVLDFGFLKFDASQGYVCGSVNYDKGCVEILENLNKHDVASPVNSVTSVSSILLPHEGGEIVSQDDCRDMDDLCKEVRCIEIEETSPSQSERSNVLLPEEGNDLLPSSTCDDTQGNLESAIKPEGDKKINAGKNIEQSVTPCPSDSSPWPSMQVFSSSRRLSLSRSRSCRAILMNKSPSCWFLEEEQIGNTPPSIFFKDFPGRPEKAQRRLFPLNYGEENNVSPKDGSQASERASLDMCRGNVKPEAQEEITGDCHSVVELKEKTQIQFQKKLIDGQVVKEKANEDAKTKSVKDIGLDPMVNPVGSPSHVLEEFEIHQREIIELWHACNVSLVHRTYFFLLFKGDPEDSIYMEVELRRLYFLKRVFTQGDVDRSMLESNCSVTLASSARALRRERMMLCRQMQKRLSAEERESIYLKWGIPLRSKQRKTKLTRLIWSETGDTDHIRESASVVAKLIGLLEPDRALKDMFGLSFTPQRFSGRSQSGKHGMPYLV